MRHPVHEVLGERKYVPKKEGDVSSVRSVAGREPLTFEACGTGVRLVRCGD